MTYRLVRLTQRNREATYYSYRLEFNDLNYITKVSNWMRQHKIEHSRVGFTIWIKEKDYTWFALTYENSMES